MTTAYHLLKNSDALLLDFDGPVCSLFANFPTAEVAAQLRDLTLLHGRIPLPATLTESQDPFDFLYYAATVSQEFAEKVELALQEREIRAANSARPTPNAHTLIQTWRETEKPLAIVSNNSVKAIDIYLQRHNLSRDVTLISARNNACPHLLKPHPHLLHQAVRTLRLQPQNCVFIGDAVTDINAARAAGTKVIGYADTPTKVVQLAEADAIVTILPKRIAD